MKVGDLVEIKDGDGNVRRGRVTVAGDPKLEYGDMVGVEWSQTTYFCYEDVRPISAVERLGDVIEDEPCAECHDEVETFNYCPHCGAAK